MCNICQVIEGLGIQEDIIKEHLQILFNSIVNVKKENLWFYVEGTGEVICLDQVERTFTYELYRQWKNNLENNPYTINAEIQKCISDDLLRLLTKKKNAEVRYPDFVLHKGQSDLSEENQLLICEVKRKNSYSGIKKDFQTFKTLMNKDFFGFPYAYAVFIQVCQKEKSIIKQIQKAINEIDTGNYPHALISSEKSIVDRIIYVSYDPRKSSSPLKAQTMAQLLKMK